MVIGDVYLAYIYLALPVETKALYSNISSISFIEILRYLFSDPGLNSRNGKNDHNKQQQQYYDCKGAKYYFPEFFDTLLKF